LRPSKELAVLFAKLIDLALNHAANRSRQLARYCVKLFNQPPAARLFCYGATIAQVAKEIGNKQRIAFRSSVPHRRKIGGK
jgi:hypothetical protein